MVIGKLPFSTHYTDQYRRQKLLVQIEKGLAESHFKELEIHGISKGKLTSPKWQKFYYVIHKCLTKPKKSKFVLFTCSISDAEKSYFLLLQAQSNRTFISNDSMKTWNLDKKDFINKQKLRIVCRFSTYLWCECGFQNWLICWTSW